MIGSDPSQVLSSVGMLVLLIMLGSVLKSFGIMPAEFAPMINRVVLTVTLPALVFRAIRSTHQEGQTFDWAVLKEPVVSVGVILGCAAIGYGLARALRLERKQAGAFVLAVMFGSTAFVGYPLYTSLIESKVLLPQTNTYHIFYSELGLLVPLVTLGLVVASYYGEGKRFTPSDLLAIPRSAPFIALLIGLLFYTDHLPGVVDRAVGTLADTTTPLMMFSLGLTINWRDLTQNWQANVLAGIVRLVIGPLLAVVLAGLLGMQGPMLQVAIIDSAMPSILLSIVYAAQFKLDVKFASALVFSNFIFALPTLLVIVSLTTGVH